MRILLVAFVTMLLAGCGVQEEGLHLDGRRMLEPAGGPQDTLELNIEMQANDLLSYSWQSARKVSFNIHSHNATMVTAYRSAIEMGDVGEFVAPHNGTFSFMWQNWEATTVVVSYKLDGAGRLER